jgi:hypothetical protein
MKVLYALDKGSNCWYMNDVLTHLAALGQIEYTSIKLINYIKPEFDQSGFDVLIYQTFPDESVKGKFNKALIELSDELFLEFEGKKFLLDSFDDCNKNGYKRFLEKFPRIKVCATKSYKKKHNTVFALPAFDMNSWFIPESTINFSKKIPRIVPIHCAFKLDHRYPHTIRNEIKAKLIDKFLDYTDFHRVPLLEYIYFLRNVRISVGGPGYGQCSHAAYHALQAGACLLHHESIDELQLLPHVDLEPGVDYVSFTMDSFDKTLQFLLDHPNVAEAIGRAGQKKFYEGIDLNKSCEKFMGIFNS